MLIEQKVLLSTIFNEIILEVKEKYDYFLKQVL